MTFYFQSMDTTVCTMQLERIAFLNPSNHWIETLNPRKIWPHHQWNQNPDQPENFRVFATHAACED